MTKSCLLNIAKRLKLKWGKGKIQYTKKETPTEKRREHLRLERGREVMEVRIPQRERERGGSDWIGRSTRWCKKEKRKDPLGFVKHYIVK
jgi:hypothetical protein